ncbi:AraC family transcriptional regulator [Chitinophaga sp. MM2321]|uniref:helix-turn-helix transcriptional regulator n=1 Tax=Chitinophaga sp. MM2321 TaxID=3137178 RepID=UPI0032D5A357
MMTAIQSPGSIQLGISDKISPLTKVYNALPSFYTQYSVNGAIVQYTEGNFGCFFRQELHNKDWIIGWMNIFITHPQVLCVVSALPVVTLQLNLEGSFCTKYGPLMTSPGECSLLYIPPRSKHRCYFKKGNYETVFISFSSRYLEIFMDQHPLLHTLYQNQQQHGPNTAALPFFYLPPLGLEILHKIRHCNQEGPLRQFRLQCWINELLLLYFTSIEQMNKPTAKHKADQEKRLQIVEDYIKKNYQSRITIPELSRIAGLNTTSFEKGFKKLFRRNPREHLEHYRIEQAAHLLKTTTQSVKEITYAIGFTDPNHFSQVFKKHFNCTPISFRKNGEPLHTNISNR